MEVCFYVKNNTLFINYLLYNEVTELLTQLLLGKGNK